jgi:hypothetical protein
MNGKFRMMNVKRIMSIEMTNVLGRKVRIEKGGLK